MTNFIIAAALLTLFILALLLYPLLRSKTSAAASRRQLNAAIYRDQLSELERDYADGGLNEADYTVSRDELQRRLLEDAGEAELPPTATAGSMRTVLALLLLLPTAAAGLYTWLGAPESFNQTTAAPHPVTASEIDRMVASLAARLEKNPDDYNGWVMLGRSYAALRRFEDATKALERAMPVVEKDASLLAIYADMLAVNAGGNLEGKPRQIIEQALKLDPNSSQALDLAGTAASNRQDFGAAVEYWERLQKLLPPDSEDAKSLAISIAKAREQASGAGGKKAAEDELVNLATFGKTISGTVELDSALKGKAAPGDTLFVFARAVNGSRMPLAVLRKHVSDLPLTFTLDDSLAITPELKLSSAGDVKLEARISKSGDATPKPGDLSGSSDVIRPGAKNVRLRIERMTP